MMITRGAVIAIVIALQLSISLVVGQQCNTASTETACSDVSSNCAWCSDAQRCIRNSGNSAQACQDIGAGDDEDGADEDGSDVDDGDEDKNGGGGGGNAGGNGSGGDGNAGGNGGGNAGGERGINCNAIRAQDDCEAEGCFFCSESEKCRESETRCPQRGNSEVIEGIIACSPLKSETQCVADGCFFCSESQICRPREELCAVGSSQTNCNSIREEDECNSSGCFFCADKEMCRQTPEKCPAGGDGGFGSDLCKPHRGDETACANAGCHFCGGNAGHCKPDEASCPGQGRSSPCRSLAESECSASDECLWCDEVSVCTGARGGRCPSPEGGFDGSTQNSSGKSCGRYSSEDECTTTSTACRWCPIESKCKKGEQTCDDGSAGVRGNPCKDALSTDECTGIGGCLWCAENSKCKKDDDGCDEDEDEEEGRNICKPFEFQVDCDDQDGCKWCLAQEKCKKEADDCGRGSEDVEVELEPETAGFVLQNDGLGATDPHRVRLKVSHLFEIAEDGETELSRSFIDLENQEYRVQQVEGTFFGLSARRISFSSAIQNVGDVELELYFMLESGSLTSPSGEVYDVNERDAKFSLNLANWVYCDTACGDGTQNTGFIDIAVQIRGSDGVPTQDQVDGSIFNLGGDVPLLLTNQLEVDGETDAMPIGFPRLEETGNGSFFVFRFPRFSQSINYDPVLQTYALKVTASSETPSSGNALQALTSVGVLSLVSCVFLMTK